MKIVGVCACTAGVAHTYMAREKLIRGAQARGHSVFVETQGTIGVEFQLTPEQIAEADVVILAIDVKIGGEDRFKGKPLIRTGTSAVIKNALGFIEQVEISLEKAKK